MKAVVKKLLRVGMVPARTWGVHAVEMVLTERLFFKGGRWQQQRAKRVRSLFMEAIGLEVEEELSTMANQTIRQKRRGLANDTQRKKKHG